VVHLKFGAFFRSLVSEALAHGGCHLEHMHSTSGSSKAASFPHHDLNTGLAATVSRVHNDQLWEELNHAVVGSHKTRDVFVIGGGKFELFADLTTACPDGTAYFFVAAAVPLGEGHVPAGATLYHAVTASQVATSPLPWRHLFKRYLSAVSTCTSCILRWNAPGSMPFGTPWLCGFSTAKAGLLLAEEEANLLRLVRQTGLNVLERCEQGAAEAAREGCTPEIDAEQYPELGGMAG